MVILIFIAVIFRDVPLERVVEDVADGNPRIDPNRLDGEHFQGPEAAESNVAEPCRDMHEQSQPADRRAAFQHGDIIVSFGPFDRAAQVQLVGVEDQSVVRNHIPSETIRPPHVEHDFLVDEELVVQPQVVAVGVEPALIERVDDDVATELSPDLVAGKNHFDDAESANWKLPTRAALMRCRAERSISGYTLLQTGPQCNLARIKPSAA